MATFIEITRDPDWQSDKAIAFDVRENGSRERIFLPLSQTREDGGVRYVSEWILSKKSEETRISAFDFVGERTIEEKQEQAIDFSNLRNFFDKAAENLSTPKVGFDGVRLNRSGERSRSPGVVHVSNGRDWHDPLRVWFGSIKRDGSFSPTRCCTQEVLDLLVKFNADPERVAANAGHNSGNCSFCFLELTQERSRSVGYGQKCAKNYGLPW